MISQNLVALIEASEGFSLTPYLDSCNIPTIGFGFTHYPNGTPVTMNDTPLVSREWAENLLEQLLEQYINGVNALAPNCNQNQKDALTDFAYNLGLGSLKGSTLLKMVLANPQDEQIRGQFMLWVHGAGQILPGLVTRRKAEADLFFTPIDAA